MANYEDDDDLNDVEENESPAEETEGGAAPSNGNNRNFLLALGVLGGIFVIAIIALVLLILNRRPGTNAAANISATNQAILLANTQTAGAATQAAGILLTPSITPLATETQIPLTPTNTQVLALATATSTPLAGQSGQLLTVTPNLQTRTATIGALLTQSAANLNRGSPPDRNGNQAAIHRFRGGCGSSRVVWPFDWAGGCYRPGAPAASLDRRIKFIK